MKLVLILLLAGLLLFVLLPLHLIALVLAKSGHPELSGIVPVWFHRGLLKLFGVRLTIEGSIVKDRPLLLVANHVSWLDIVVMSAVAPLSFVAKAEMATWPFFGTLAKLQRTIFVERQARRSSAQQASQIAERMTQREIMVLFPEGTTTDGNHLSPFKTPLFEAAKIAVRSSSMETATVQPVAIDYTRLHGLPLGRGMRPHVAWPGDVGLGESFIPLVREGALDVTIRLGAPILLTKDSNRKVVASQAVKSIREMLAIRKGSKS